MLKLKTRIVNRILKTKTYKALEKMVFDAITYKKGRLFFYDTIENPAWDNVLRIVEETRKKTEVLLKDSEAYQIFILTQKTGKIKGDLAEVGAYKGGSAKLICEAKGGREFFVFDAFDSIPDSHEASYEGQLAATEESVKDLLKDYKNVYLLKGIFPDTSFPVQDRTFSFVHLDVNTYVSTLAALKFFYPRLNKGGILISHNYADLEGVRRAFDEFFSDKPEVVIELASLQCLISKT